jgi:hypothetical protein
VEATGFTLAGASVESASSWTPGLARQGTTMYSSAQVYRQHYGEETATTASRKVLQKAPDAVSDRGGGVRGRDEAATRGGAKAKEPRSWR